MPSTRRVSGALDRLRVIVERYIRIDPLTPDAGASETEAEAVSTNSTRAGPPSEAVRREYLLDQVAALARSFRRLEPNSPISYTLEEAVRRANLTWPELMRELVSEGPQLANILSSVGLRPPAEPRNGQNEHEF